MCYNFSMRKILATIFWIFTSVLYILNIMFLLFLVAKTFNVTFLNDFCLWFADLIQKVSPETNLLLIELGKLWLIYLLICVPVVAICQYFGQNLGNQEVSFPILKTLFGILSGILKLVLVVALISIIFYFIFYILL